MITTENRLENVAVSLSGAVERFVNEHLLTKDGQNIDNLYQLIIEEIEIPLYKAALAHCRYNQVRAAILLGVSRGTLRTRLRRYFSDKYVGTRDN